MIVSEDTFFSHISDVKIFSEVIDEIPELKARIMKQVGRIFFASFNFINYRIYYQFLFYIV